MSHSTEMEGLGIQSLEIGIDIVKHIATAKEPLSIGEIAEQVGMSKSRMHRYLTSLHRTGFIRRDRDLRYTIGPEIITIGLNAVNRVDIRDVARPALIRLRERLNETVALSVWTEHGPYYLHWVESGRAVNVGIRVGAQVSAMKSAGGKVFLAFLPADETEQVVRRELLEHGIIRADYEAEMDRIRDRGYSTTTESLLPNIVTIGCPVFGRNGEIIAAITVVGILGDLNVAPDSPVIAALKEESATLSRSLG